MLYKKENVIAISVASQIITQQTHAMRIASVSITFQRTKRVARIRNMLSPSLTSSFDMPIPSSH